MDTCLWNEKLVIASDISNSYELEKKIRIASAHKELMCPDPQCEAVIIYRHGEKKQAHFAHLKKSDACDYDEYDRSNNEYIKKVKTTLYNHFNSLGYDIQMDVKLLEHHYTHLAISFNDGSKIALELGTKSVTANHIEKISKQYFDKNITVRWIVIDNIETDLKESQTYYIKRSSLNESENRDLIVIDFEADNVAQYKMDLDKYQYNNNDFYPVSNQNPYKYVSNISQLTILNKDISLSGFNKLFESWKLKKQAQLLSSIEEIEIEKKRREKLLNSRLSATKGPEIKAEVKQNNLRKSIAKTQAYKPDEEPFILEKITIPRTKLALDGTMFYKWGEEDFKEKIKMAVDEDITAVKMLISMITFHCREKIGRKFEQWDGYVKNIRNYGSHYEILIESRSGFLFMIGKYANGAFISIPAFGVGCDLSSYNDYFWNNEKLARLMNPVDAATIAEALRTLHKNNYI